MATKVEQDLVQKIIKGYGEHWGKGIGPERVAAVAQRIHKVDMNADTVRTIMEELGIEDPT